MSFAGVDVGTQSLKVVIVDQRLAVLGVASEPYQPTYPGPGMAEQDPSLWERALRPALERACGSAAAVAAIEGLAISGQLDGCVPVGADGVAAGPCLIWSDRRATDELAGLDSDALRQATGLTADASHMAAKVLWFQRHGMAAARYHQPVSYLVQRLTGESVFDHGLASTTMLYDLHRRDYSEQLSEQLGIPRARELLPEIREATALAGPVNAAGAAFSGLPVGTPVAVGTGDDFSTPLGAGILAPGAVACVLGTAQVVGALAALPIIDPAGLVETHAYVDRQYFVENPGWLAGGAVQWVSRCFGLADAGELDRLASSAPPGSGGVLFPPTLTGATAPVWNAGARGCWYGLTPAHGPAHMARAMLEGCAFAARDVIVRLQELGVAADQLVLLGGGGASRLWGEIHASVTGLPVRVVAQCDSSALGAAMLALVAVGAQPSLRACTELVGATSSELLPRSVESYEQPYLRYRALFECLRPMFG